MKIKDRIKKLELQVDYLIGYRPSGHPWKAEYCLRKSMIERMGDNQKLRAIRKELEGLYRKLPHKQGYLRYTQQEYTTTLQDTPIAFKEHINGKQVITYITRGGE